MSLDDRLRLRSTAARARRSVSLLDRAWWLSSRGRDWRARLRILLLVGLMPIKTRVPGLARRHVGLRLWLDGCTVDVWLSDHSELLVIEEIWRRGEYAQAAQLARSATRIVDLGANIGLASLWFRALNPDARIVSVEADPRTYTKLVRNVGADPRIETVNAAIVDRSGTVSFMSAEDSWTSRVGAPGEVADVEVRGVTLDDLVAELAIDPPDLVKIDIEGMEWAVLPASGCLRGARMVIGEIHPSPERADSERFLDDVASVHGLTRVPAATPRHFVFIGSR